MAINSFATSMSVIQTTIVVALGVIAMVLLTIYFLCENGKMGTIRKSLFIILIATLFILCLKMTKETETIIGNAITEVEKVTEV